MTVTRQYTAPTITAVRATNRMTAEIEGYLALWGSPAERDCVYTWFDRERPPELGLDLLPVPLFFEHNLDDGNVRESRVGRVTSAWFDEHGIRFRGELDKWRARYQAVLDYIKSGQAYISSGSAEHLVKFDEDGRFVDWPLAEVSITRDPCEPRMPNVQLIRRAAPSGERTSTASRSGASQSPGPAVAVPHTTRCNASQDTGAKCSCKHAAQLTDSKLTRGKLMPTLEELGLAGATADQIVFQLVEQFGRDLVVGVYDNVFAVEDAPLDSPDQLVANAVAAYPEADAAQVQLIAEVLHAFIMERPDEVGDLVEALSGAEEPADEEPLPDAEAVMADDDEELEELMRRRSRPSRLPQRRPAQGLDTSNVSPALAKVIRREFERAMRQAASNRAGLTPRLPRTPKGTGQRQESAGITQVTDRRFDHLSALEMAFGYELRAGLARRGEGRLPTDAYVRAMSHKVEQAVRRNDELRDRFGEYEQTRTMGAVRSDRLFNAIRADELTSITNNSTWAGDFFSDQVWFTLRTQRVYQFLLAAGLQEVEVPQGASTFKILAEGSDPTVYFTGESEDAGSSVGIPTATAPIATPNLSLKTISVSKLSVRLMPTGEATEDTFIELLPFITQSMQEAMQAAFEYVIILGDTETGATGNINSDDGAPSATAKYLAMDGFAKDALVTNTANSVSVGAAPTASTYNQNRKLLGVNGNNPANVVHLMDLETYYESMEIEEVETIDKFGQGATIITGHIDSIYGSPVLQSDQIGLAEADGKRSVTESNNTLGRIITVSAPRWKLGWKRRMTPETMRWPGADVTEIVMHTRFGLINADSNGSAVGYNITV